MRIGTLTTGGGYCASCAGDRSGEPIMLDRARVVTATQGLSSYMRCRGCDEIAKDWPPAAAVPARRLLRPTSSATELVDLIKRENIVIDCWRLIGNQWLVRLGDPEREPMRWYERYDFADPIYAFNVCLEMLRKDRAGR